MCHLIHHTGALPSMEVVWQRMESAGERDWTSNGVISVLAGIHELEDPPGTAYAYSNVGYICVARILERITGETLGTFAEAQLFGPLEMSNTALTSEPPQVVPSPAALSVGGGGLWTSVRDLLRWNEVVLRDTLGVSETIHTTGTLDDGAPFDYGWASGSSTPASSRCRATGGAGATQPRSSFGCRASARASRSGGRRERGTDDRLLVTPPGRAAQRRRLLSSRSMRRFVSRSAMSRRLSRPSLPRARASSTFARPFLK